MVDKTAKTDALFVGFMLISDAGDSKCFLGCKDVAQSIPNSKLPSSTLHHARRAVQASALIWCRRRRQVGCKSVCIWARVRRSAISQPKIWSESQNVAQGVRENCAHSSTAHAFTSPSSPVLMMISSSSRRLPLSRLAAQITWLISKTS